MEEIRSQTKSPKVISVIMAKGGQYKTTVAFNLLKHLQSKGSAYAVDFDQQNDLKALAGKDFRPVADTEDILDLDSDWVVVDTGPEVTTDHSELMDLSKLTVCPVTLDYLPLKNLQRLLKHLHPDFRSKFKVIIFHDGERSRSFKAYRDQCVEICREFGVEILAEVRSSREVSNSVAERLSVMESDASETVKRNYKKIIDGVERYLQ